jgi:hypothetical protein
MMNKKVLIAIVVGVVALILIACCVGAILIGRQASQDVKAMEDEFGSLRAVCEGGSVDSAAVYAAGSGVHPTMGFELKYGDSLVLRESIIPEEARPEMLGETELVLYVGEQEEMLVESCEYFPMGENEDEEKLAIIERYAYEREVTLIEARTGEVVAQETLRGTEPDECPEEARFSDEGETKTEYGGTVSDEDVLEWVRSYVIVP